MLPKSLNDEEKSVDPNDIIIIDEKGDKVIKMEGASSNLQNGSVYKVLGQSTEVKGGNNNPFPGFTLFLCLCSFRARW